MSAPGMFPRVVRSLPRGDLERFAKDWNPRPWLMNRRELELLLVHHDTADLRADVLDCVRERLGVPR